MTEDEMKSKFLSLAEAVVGRTKAKKAMEMILDLEHLDSVAKLIPYLK